MLKYSTMQGLDLIESNQEKTLLENLFSNPSSVVFLILAVVFLIGTILSIAARRRLSEGPLLSITMALATVTFIVYAFVTIPLS